MYMDELTFNKLTYGEIIDMMELNREKGTSPSWIIRLFNDFSDETCDGDHRIYLSTPFRKKFFETVFEEEGLLNVLKHYDADDPFLTQYFNHDEKNYAIESVSSIWDVIHGDLELKFHEWLADYFEE